MINDRFIFVQKNLGRFVGEGGCGKSSVEEGREPVQRTFSDLGQDKNLFPG
jgi:hypothetical protein